jgi:hypothetical protein
MKMRNGKLSGTHGELVYANTKDGQVVRSRPSRRPRNTAARVRRRQGQAAIAGRWRTLSNEQFAAWEAAAKEEGTKAYWLYCRINGVLDAAGEPLVMDPPKREKIAPNPVGELEISNRGGKITLRLRVPCAPAELTLVLGVPCCSRGQSAPRTNCVTLGRLPKAVSGWSDITALYVQKYGVPPVGCRVFIRTQQVINGRKDAPKATCADVPPPKAEGS